MITYYKGWKDNVDFIAEYDDEADAVKDDDYYANYPVRIISMGNPNWVEREFNTIKEAQDKGYYFASEISVSEFNVLIALKKIYSEVRLHDIIGGFPRHIVISQAIDELYSSLMCWKNEIEH